MSLSRLTRAQLITQGLTPRLNLLQKVEAWNHPGEHISDTVVQFPYGNWVASPAPVYRRNTASGWSIVTPTSTDTDVGTATFSDLRADDDIFATYTFQYFSTTDLEYFFNLAMHELNNTPPATSYDFTDYPTDAANWLVSYAYKLALETLLVDLLTWKATLVWNKPESLSSIVQGTIGRLEAYFASNKLTIKGRRSLSPKSISAGKWKVPALVSEATWQHYTIAGV